MDIGDRIEGVIDKHAGKIGVGLAALAGIGESWNSLLKVTYPDSVGNKNALERYLWLVQHGGITLLADQSGGYFSGLNYLKYKFTDPTSSWAKPFWTSLAAYILSQLDIIPPRLNRPLKNSRPTTQKQQRRRVNHINTRSLIPAWDNARLSKISIYT